MNTVDPRVSLSTELQAAIHELQRYLGDEMAPMMVTDSVLLLMDQPPAIVAPQINVWVGSQYSRGGGPKYTTSDYIYHALKKIHLLGEFHLIDLEKIDAFVAKLTPYLLAYCPAEEAAKLQEQISRLGETAAGATTASPVANIYQAGISGGGGGAGGGAAGSGGAGSATPADDAIGRGLKQLSLLLERLGGQTLPATPQGASPEMDQLRMQALVTAALGSRDEAELQAHLRRLGGAGVDARSDQVFRMLGRSLPAWSIPIVAMPAGADGAAYTNRSMEAMRKVVELAETPQEWARRFNDLVQAAIDQFNEGSLARAATMLDLAEQMLAGKERHQDVVQAIRRRAHEKIKEEQLKKYAERPEDRQVLLRFMNFFSAFTVEGLLKQLHDEPKRDRRWLLLMLLEAHGANARAAALQELESFVRGEKSEPHGYHQRNLIFLLRRIPAPESGPSDKEMEILTRYSKVGQAPIVVREAVRTLGPLKTAAAERTLAVRLKEFEAMALKQNQAPAGEGRPHPVVEILDTICSALALQRTSLSSNAILQHALREEPALGDAAARLDGLGAQDLSSCPDAVERLLQALTERLPKKILGLVIQKGGNIQHLIRALSSTPHPSVRATLEEIAAKFPNQEIGTDAAKVLGGLKTLAGRPAEPAAPGLSGDLDLFGLPNLFQSFSDTKINGTLTLRDERGKVCGTVRFRDGKIRTCSYLHLKGEDASYQLFEKPEARKFVFHAEAAQPPTEAESEALIEVMPLLMEAMRRHDELQQARALVPDGARLQVTATKPKRLEEEEDLSLTKAVWSKTVAGSTPEQCEAQVSADSYRVRRLLAHWVEGGALKVGAAASAPAPATA